jgi:hypothetical protein
MDYFTSEAQEKAFNEKYNEILYREQDRLRYCLNKKIYNIPEIERRFYVENEKIYLGKIHESCICPNKYVQGGRQYSIDSSFYNDICNFIKRNKKYMIIFFPSGRYYNLNKKYKSNMGELPAIIISNNEEIILEDESKYVLDNL